MEKSDVAEHAWDHHHPIHWEETTVLDHGREKGVVGEESLAHPDDTCGRALQLRWRTESPGLLDCCDEEPGAIHVQALGNDS